MPSARSRAVNSSQGEASSSSQMRILATRRSIHGTHRALANEEMARMRERLATMRQSYRLHAPPRNLGHISQYVPISMNDSSSDVPQLTIPLVSLDEVGPLDESRADDDESDDLKCPICFDVFGDPKILPCCGHSICSNCEVNVMSRGDYNNFSCPVCGTRGTLRIGSLKLNYSLKEAMTILKKTRQEKVDCEGCEKSIILTEVFWCKSCHPEDKKKICSHCGFKDHRGHDIERFQFMEADTRKQKIDELKDYVGWLDDSFLHRDIIAVHKLYKTMRTETAMATTRLANNNCVSQEEFYRELEQIRVKMEKIQRMHRTMAALLEMDDAQGEAPAEAPAAEDRESGAEDPENGDLEVDDDNRDDRSEQSQQSERSDHSDRSRSGDEGDEGDNEGVEDEQEEGERDEDVQSISSVSVASRDDAMEDEDGEDNIAEETGGEEMSEDSDHQEALEENGSYVSDDDLDGRDAEVDDHGEDDNELEDAGNELVDDQDE